MLLWTGFILIVLGVLVWLFGNRMWLLGAGAGALLGIGLMHIFPELMDGVFGLLVVIGLAVGLGVLGFLGKPFMKLVAMGIGFVAAGGLAMSVIDVFNLSFGIFDWLLAVAAGAAGALLFARYFDWGMIIMASLIGSWLVVRGVLLLLAPGSDGLTGTLIAIALTALGIYYHYRQNKRRLVAK